MAEKIRDPFDIPHDENQAEKGTTSFLFVLPPSKGDAEGTFVDIIDGVYTVDEAKAKYEAENGRPLPENVLVFPEDSDEGLNAA